MSEKPIDLNNLTKEEKMKYEIAEELGLLDRVMENGWRSLTAKETGRIGGLMNRKRKEQKSEEQKRWKSNKYITDIKKCEQFVTKVEMERFICYNRKTGIDVSR